VIILVVLGYGAIRLRNSQAGRQLVVAAVASDQHLEFPAYQEENERLARNSVQTVVLPENQLRVTADNAGEVMNQLSALARQNNVLVVCGLHRLEPSNNCNEAVAFSPQGQLLATYIKHHLFPGTSDIPGNEIVVLTARDAQSGIEICKDMDFPTPSRQYAQRGIEVMFVPASDCDVDGRMHSRMAVMRAVENGFALVRAARRGLLTVSDNRGRIISERPSNSAPLASMVAAVSIQYDKTIYGRTGDWTA
jgi:apolipoprotein N-acyltransferase